MRASFLLILLMSLSCCQALSQVLFSLPGGLYEHPFSLELTGSGHEIRYTLDGSAPNTLSPLYSSPLSLSTALYSQGNLFAQQIAPDQWWNPPNHVEHAIVVRAVEFDAAGNKVGTDAVGTWLVSDLCGYKPHIPVVSIVIEPAALLDADSGIFSHNGWQADDDFQTGNFNQHGREWERWAHIEYYDPDGPSFSQWIGLRVHGGKTRRFMQKPLKLYARKEYGKKTIDCPIFGHEGFSDYKRLILRPFSATWNEDGIADHLAQQMARPLRFVSLASRPVTLYINGEYWGLYYLQEAPDQHLVAQIDDVASDDVDVIGSWDGLLENGTSTSFDHLISFLNAADLSDTLQYRELCNLIDVDAFVDYQLFEAFIANRDWPANNMRCFQHGDTPWHWFFYDGDAAFADPDLDMTGRLTYEGHDSWPSSSNATLCMRRMLQAPEFITLFNSRMRQLCTSVFDYRHTKLLLDSALSIVEDEVRRQSDRFGMPSSLGKWRGAVGDIDRFLRRRVERFESQMLSMLAVPSHARVDCRLYPNPAHAVVNIGCNSEATGVVQCELFNTVGQRIFRTSFAVSGSTNTVVDIAMLPPGVYIARFLPSGETHRLVVH